MSCFDKPIKAGSGKRVVLRKVKPMDKKRLPPVKMEIENGFGEEEEVYLNLKNTVLLIQLLQKSLEERREGLK